MQVRAYQKEKGPAPMHVGYMHILQELLSTAVQVLIRHSCLFKMFMAGNGKQLGYLRSERVGRS
jgi:hypothetical protein